MIDDADHTGGHLRGYSSETFPPSRSKRITWKRAMSLINVFYLPLYIIHGHHLKTVHRRDIKQTLDGFVVVISPHQSRSVTIAVICDTFWPFNAHCCHIATAIKHPVHQTGLIFDIRVLWRTLSPPKRQSARMSKIKNYTWRLNPLWLRTLYNLAQ